MKSTHFVYEIERLEIIVDGREAFSQALAIENIGNQRMAILRANPSELTPVWFGACAVSC
jgi:hypothetical protein